MSDNVIDETIPEPAEVDNTERELSTAVDNSEEQAPPDDTQDESGDQPANREARYRIRAKEAEAERDRLAEQLTAMRRSQIDAQADALGIKPAALWASGTQLEDMLGDDGVPDPEKITAAVKAARDTLGIHTAARMQLGSRSGSGASATGQPQPNRWTNAFAPKAD